MKPTIKSFQTLQVFIGWTLVSLYSVHLATMLLLLLLLLGLIMLTKGNTREMLANIPVASFGDKILSWTVFTYIAICTYPFTALFWTYISVEIIGGAIVHFARKEYMENE